MSGQLAFLDIDGAEVANSYRTLSYLRLGLGTVKWEVRDLGCLVLAREVGGVGPFVSPSVDPAPWYDAGVAESAEFLGLVLTNLDFQTTDTSRSIRQRFGGVGGGTISYEQAAARQVAGAGYLIASTCAGLEYGRHWIAAQLGESSNEACELVTLRVRDACPPDNGLNDARGEWIIYDAALVEGIRRTDPPALRCCDYDGVAFTLAGQSPYLFKRTGTATSAIEIANAGGLMVPQPATLDTFVRANQGPPPTGWTGSTFTGEGNTLRVLSNLLDNSVHTGGTTGSAHWTAAQYGPSVAVTVLVSTRVNNGGFELRARVINPASANAAGCIARIIYGAAPGQDSLILGRRTSAGGYTAGTYTSQTGLTFASGDTYALVCRGNQISLWRKPSGGAWTRVGHAYDPTTPAAGYVGLALVEGGATQTLSTFAAGTLTNGDAFPTNIVSTTIPASATAIGSPLITIVADAANSAEVSAGDIRIQLKQHASCEESDSFTTNTIPTAWYQTSALYAVSAAKLKPSATGARLIRRSEDGTLAGLVLFPGGKVEAQVKLGATIAGGVWGVTLDPNIVARISQAGVFAIASGTSGTVFDSVAFAPVAATTYRIILEALPLGAGLGWDVRAYLIDQAAPSLMLTRPLRATVITVSGTAIGPLFTPGITSVAADTAEEWDAFYAVDSGDPDGYIGVAIPPGTLVIDVARRVSTFTPKGSLISVDGSAYMATPSGTPLYWPETLPNTGPGCVQIWANAAANPGTTLQVALQSRTR